MCVSELLEETQETFRKAPDIRSSNREPSYCEGMFLHLNVFLLANTVITLCSQTEQPNTY